MKYVAITLVYVYRYTLAVLFPTSCKYHPSCSQYAIEAFRAHGLLWGAILAGWRLLRCNPWSDGGVDKVPDRRPRLSWQRVSGAARASWRRPPRRETVP
ncbi:MAG: membrane protein insertion efficiency factor YidD [Actinomycetota bacterium]|nr:membrane protein insertion efficiency factor YidD [Actinomycetota bacterium]